MRLVDVKSTNGPDLWTGPDGRSYNLWFPKP